VCGTFNNCYLQPKSEGELLKSYFLRPKPLLEQDESVYADQPLDRQDALDGPLMGVDPKLHMAVADVPTG